jgi:dihydroxy-acid dehydratase
MRQIVSKLSPEAITVTGRPLVEGLEDAPIYNDDVIRPLSNPVYHEGSLAVLKGNLAPDGAIIKPAACDPKYHKHSGPALVADSYPDLKKIIDDPDYPMTSDTVLVLRNAGPQGGPGMPEWGMIPMPKALLKDGHRDMVRLSDARMSGTSYGACILHVAPEAWIGGPLALLRTGDIIDLDIPNRTLSMRVTDEELAERRAAWTPPEPRYERGYGYMFTKHIEQADKGCDFDFLRTEFGAPVDEPVIY